MIIDDKTIKLKNKKLKRDRWRERWNKRRIRKRTKKVIKMLRKLYIRNNDLNIQLDSTLIAFDLKPVLDEMVQARLITYDYQGSIFKIRILTADDIFKADKAVANTLTKKTVKKSSTTANIKKEDELETVDIKLDLDDSDEVQDDNMFDEG